MLSIIWALSEACYQRQPPDVSVRRFSCTTQHQIDIHRLKIKICNPYSTQKMLFFFHWGLFLVSFGSINVVTANAKLLNWSFFGKPNGNRIFRCQNVDFNSFRLHKLKRIPFNWCYKLITLNQLGIYVGVVASINRYVYDWLLEKLTINMLFWPSHRRCRLGIRLINLIPLKIDVGNTLWVLYNWWWRTMLSRELPLWSNKLKV